MYSTMQVLYLQHHVGLVFTASCRSCIYSTYCDILVFTAPTVIHTRSPTQISMSDTNEKKVLLDYGDELVIAAVTSSIQGCAAVCK
jgi:hypothetical protein